MKKRLLFWMAALLVAIGGVQQAFAQASYNHTYTQGVAVAEGDYFLYNIGAGMFLTDGMDYGTHASVDHAGRVITRQPTATATEFTHVLTLQMARTKKPVMYVPTDTLTRQTSMRVESVIGYSHPST